MLNKDGLLVYDISPEVTAFSTSRHCQGVSVDVYGKMNINPYCGDDATVVYKNRQILAKTLSIQESSIFLPHQIHKTTIKLIDKTFLDYSKQQQIDFLENTDGLVTQCKDICIGVSTADCVPLLLYDNVLRVAAALHAGWRGTLDNIAARGVDVMCRHYGSNPINIKVVIGPSICLESFEVGSEVLEKFLNKGFESSKISVEINGKPHIDLWAINISQLLNAGVLPQHIHSSNICTYLNCSDFFSARRLSINSGRIFTGIIIRSEL